MGRPSYTIEWINHPPLVLKLEESYNFWYGYTDLHGNAYTKIRNYMGHNATVIQGNQKIVDDSIYIQSSTKIWSCRIYSGGKVSSIGLKGEYVTVIIHM